jgi:hypothetical protein
MEAADRARRRGRISVSLPSAPPELYLQWVAFVAAIEHKIRSHPQLRLEALGKRFVFGESARASQRVLLEPITHQAEDADAASSPRVEPMIQATPRMLAKAVEYLERWGEWIVGEDVSAQAHVPLPTPEAAALMAQVQKTIRLHLAKGT